MNDADDTPDVIHLLPGDTTEAVTRVQLGHQLARSMRLSSGDPVLIEAGSVHISVMPFAINADGELLQRIYVRREHEVDENADS